MKVRTDFVTNSSSSSFLIVKKGLTVDQINAIRYHSELGESLDLRWAGEAWQIEENEYYISGYTWMDNFNIFELLRIINAERNVIATGEYKIDLPDEPPESEIDGDEPWVKKLHDIMNGVKPSD